MSNDLMKLEFIKEFVKLYGFKSLIDFKTEISVKSLKRDKSFLSNINGSMSKIRELYPMTLFNLSRKEYLIDSENLAIKVLRKCLECSNITYEHIHKQSGNSMRLIFPNIMYMNYIIQENKNMDMKDIIHDLEMSKVNALFVDGKMDIANFRKKTAIVPSTPYHKQTRQDLCQPDTHKIIKIPLLPEQCSPSVNLFDYLNEFCVINSIYCTKNKGGNVNVILENNGFKILDLYFEYQKSTESTILTENLCDYDHPLPMSIFYKGGLKLQFVSNCFDYVYIDYTENTTIDINSYKKLFCSGYNICEFTHSYKEYAQICTDTNICQSNVIFDTDNINRLEFNISANCHGIVSKVELHVDGICIDVADNKDVCVFNFDGLLSVGNQKRVKYLIYFSGIPQGSVIVFSKYTYVKTLN